MQFLTSREAVDFLSQAAPRPWVCHMLRWMVVDDQLPAFFSKSQFQASTRAYEFLWPLIDEIGEKSGPKLDALVAERYDSGLASKLKGKSGMETIFDDPCDWEADDGPEHQDMGFFLFATEIDWNAGILVAEWLPTDDETIQIFFPSGEFLFSEFEDPFYSARLEGLVFEKSRIEMMLPNFNMSEIGLPSQPHSAGRRHVGRPRIWDWDGAMAYLVAEAQSPDGLPTGHGAQARIETMIAEWFESKGGSSPAVSQIRKRASAIMRTLETG